MGAYTKNAYGSRVPIGAYIVRNKAKICAREPKTHKDLKKIHRKARKWSKKRHTAKPELGSAVMGPREFGESKIHERRHRRETAK